MSSKKIKVSLAVIEGEDKGKTFDISQDETVIGRADSDIIIRDRKISRRHAMIKLEGGKVFIRDQGSTNGIFVNDLKVDEVELKNLDEITLGFSKISIAIVEDLRDFRAKNVPSVKTGKVPPSEEKTDIERMIEEELSKFSRWDVSGDEGGEAKEEKILTKTNFAIEVIEGPDKGKKSKLRNSFW